MNILFATGNDRKLREARAACDDFGIEVEQAVVSIDEIQHHEPLEITKHKINKAYEVVGQPVVVTDTSWSIPSLNGFPGGYMKDVEKWFRAEDFINIVNGLPDRRISFTETIAYKDADETKFFSQEYWGSITAKPRGNGNSIEQVAEFNGRTIAESHDIGEFSHDPKDYVWYQFAEWYKAKNH